MDLGLKDKLIFIAGASRGIGIGIADAVMAEGAKLFITARSPGPLEEARKRLADQYGADRIGTFAGDMRETQAIEEALERAEQELGPIWGAVANVGIHPCPRGYEVGDEDWDAGINQNLGSSYRLARGALRRMVPRGEGSVVLISSLAGSNSIAAPLSYGVSKAGVNHMAQDLARFTGEANVRVNAVAPGFIYFPGCEWEERLQGPMADHWKGVVARDVPLQRFGTAEEVGTVVAFALSPVAGYVNGTVLMVDGGHSR